MTKRIITLKFEGKSVEIKKLPLGRYVDLIKAIKLLPKHLPELSGLAFDEVLKKLPGLVEDAYPDFIDILMIATPLTKEDLESDWFGLGEAVDAILAVVEVNNYQEIFDKIKKATAHQDVTTN